MKTTLLLLFVLLFTCSIPSFCSAAKELDPVLDTAGKKLKAGSLYNIVPLLPGSGGGIILQVTGNKTCPFDVVQYPDAWYTGQPLAFSPVNSKKGDIIRVSTDLNIDFPNTITSCRKYSNVWMLDQYDPTAGEYFVTTGGVKGKPGPKTIRNWFKIEKFEQGYKLVYRPSVCSHCQVMYNDIGIVAQDGQRRLALSSEPFKVVFQED